MTTYRVSIPEPSAERLKAEVFLTVRTWDGWEYFQEEEYRVQVGQTVEFTVNGQATPEAETSWNDSLIFRVFATYRNRTGSRSEDVVLVPERVLETAGAEA